MRCWQLRRTAELPSHVRESQTVALTLPGQGMPAWRLRRPFGVVQNSMTRPRIWDQVPGGVLLGRFMREMAVHIANYSLVAMKFLKNGPNTLQR